ncbi:MAG: 2,3-bisphosphoglycerate-independent phosphoglycerate mutase [Lachnospiraceae bacterium]|nr:2,3-bisphosphoglycerate-independent phosphoglycerate mutase [Lachnospiraceae bacterium]MCH4030117.1 2,3-bisphosphoglycerate-independent phosphoglycerate mutase [Lachnospiraceae bacterium]MCH4070229.1 2,3-bisphosphoglycerate-independent phosphoglycerate mutase [Lachnospiraceae bacterium]MCH4107735.1 2,3-bisphosphoglycerate-independent phosphoglycerate mutase [Lachnospiraceae bacterium]MCI1301414.1 2,3-bisphosphoglycerate-independent phosphoglycerate mutase [Lachnospiraceae bacterium]
MGKPVVLVVMDGVGWTDKDNGNAVMHSYKPQIDELMTKWPHTTIKASGTAVGLPSDNDMGNSEVGHNALGCGQIYSQGAKLVNESIESGKIYESQTWKDAVAYCKEHNGKMHFIGLLSDGNVHSNISHLIAMLKEAKKEGVKEARVHALLDGRDVPETSALTYIDQIEKVFAELNDDNFHACLASGGGRMTITMDRYEADWSMVERGWHIHVMGDGRMFSSATEAIETYRKEGGYTDQYLPGFVIAKDGKPVGPIDDGDSVVFFNFRGDRAVEISKAFDYMDKGFDAFPMPKKPKVYYCGMLQYDGDLKLPDHFLVAPPHIEHTMSEYLVKKGVKSYACSETQKFGHMTYFWNGNRSNKFSEELEDWEEVPSDIIPFDQKPWMKATEVTEKMEAAIASGKYQFLRCNYPNGDMVGHTGNYEATIIGVESVDLNLRRIMDACKKYDYTLLVMADHGNSDEMVDKKGKPKTSHSLARVPFAVYNGPEGTEIKDGDFGLANVAATVCKILGFTDWPEQWLEPIIK